MTTTPNPQDYVWPDPNSDGWVDAWNGWYATEAEARSETWSNNAIQFPRLIDELQAVITEAQLTEVCESMDLAPEELAELFDRAQTQWDAIKAATR